MKVVIFCLIWLVCSQGESVPLKPCPLETSCGKVDSSDEVCGLDEELGCIRKYPSRCHLNIAACQAKKNFTDYSNVYCSMEAYACEQSPTYERWTIFFGYEND
ncbi:uncharacterized protein [Drosophila bipectinata]|uniref:uncharacterized protein n=1 Tax=Drosophila bipectinata TaxID=42026 RepID=UPI001C89BEF5|nr:uncharacterized protein LOC108129088 [Drosophila bipectinata]